MNSRELDPLSPELRSVERMIDNYYKQNPLINTPFAVAAWHFMAFCEDILLMELLKGRRSSIHDFAVLADNLVNHIQYPLLWLRTSCPPGGQVPFSYDDDSYKAARDLSKLGEDYDPFRVAFTYASRGLIDMELQGSTIVPSYDLLDARYQAYDFLVSSTNPPEFEMGNLFDLIEKSLKVSDDKFEYKLNPRTVKLALEVLTPVADSIFTLPDEWQFSNYSMGEFRRVSMVLIAIAYIHFIARLKAVSRGCKGLGYSCGLFVLTYDELLRRIVRYSRVPENVVSHLLDDLTYGCGSISLPDPAIQPLIKLNDNQYAIMPSLFISNSAERNFTILLNRLPSERAIYSRLVSEKEDLMRERMKEQIASHTKRFFQGKIPARQDLPDIDLAIISDVEKVCIVLELKWFIEPAEVREVIEKSEEIQKGISQLLLLSQAISEDSDPIFNALAIDSTYQLFFVVASANSIGLAGIQNSRIPVIRESHLVRKLNSTLSLRDVIDWLSSRSFLPREGVHYEVVEDTRTIGQWSIKWYGIKLLSEEELVNLRVP